MDYLNRPDVRELLGVGTPANFSSCSDPVYDGFVKHMDMSRVQTQFYVAQLLEVRSCHFVHRKSDEVIFVTISGGFAF